jgi:hypothetical protein
MIRVTAILVSLSLIGCGQGNNYASSVEDEAYTAQVDEDAARESARSELEGTTYVGQGAVYGCTSDCSGHDAGYEWAQENEIEDPSDCGGKSASFIEGCEAYAEEFQRQVEEEEQEQLSEEGW